MCGWGCGALLLVGSGWVLALRDGLLDRLERYDFVKRHWPFQALSRRPEKSERPLSCNWLRTPNAY